MLRPGRPGHVYNIDEFHSVHTFGEEKFNFGKTA